MKYLVLFFGLSILFWSCKSDKAPERDETGEIVLPPADEDFDPSEYKWGYIDTSGNLKLKDLYDDCRDFKDNHAVVRVGGRWGLINRTGIPTIPIQYKGVWSLSEGLARVMTFEDSIGFMDANANWVIPPQFGEAQDFKEGLARVRVGDKYGYINPKGEWIIPAEYVSASPTFEQGYSVVKKISNYGLIDTKGKTIIPFDYQRITTPKFGLCKVKKQGKFGYLNLKGEVIIPFKFSTGRDFEGGYAAVKESDYYGLISIQGEYAVDPIYDQIWYAGENRWAVRDGAQYGFIDETGDIKVPIVYDNLYKITEGIACYQYEDFWGFIDKDGKRLTQPEFGLVWPFKDGHARAATQRGIIVINKQGEVAVPSIYLDMRDFHEGLAKAQVYRYNRKS